MIPKQKAIFFSSLCLDDRELCVCRAKVREVPADLVQRQALAEGRFTFINPNPFGEGRIVHYAPPPFRNIENRGK